MAMEEPLLAAQDGNRDAKGNLLQAQDGGKRKVIEIVDESVMYCLPKVQVEYRPKANKMHWCIGFRCKAFEDNGSLIDDGIKWDDTVAQVATNAGMTEEEFIGGCFCDQNDEDWGVGDEVSAQWNPKSLLGLNFQDFNKKFRTLLVDRLQSAEFGLHLEAETSVDHDEVFLQISCPIQANPANKRKKQKANKNGKKHKIPVRSLEVSEAPTEAPPDEEDEVEAMSAAELLAERYDVLGKCTHKAYGACSEILHKAGRLPEGVNYAMPVDQNGCMYPNWMAFDKSAQEIYLRETGKRLYSNFSEAVRIRMVKKALDDLVDLDFLLAHKLISSYFPIHDMDGVNAVEDCLPSIIPKFLGGAGFKPFPRLNHNGVAEEGVDTVKRYLGEEAGFYYSFILFYTQQLLRPVIYTVILLFGLEPHCGNDLFPEWKQEFGLGPDQDWKPVLRFVYACLIAAWASHLINDMASREAAMTIRWGQNENSGAAKLAPGYDYVADLSEGKWQERHLWMHVRLHRYFSNFLTVLVMLYILTSTAILSYMQKSKDGKASEDQYLFALAITINNRITGMVWDATARWIVTKENHKTMGEMNESLAVKLYLIYLFNWIYPFINLGFLKRGIIGCPADPLANPPDLTLVIGGGDCLPELRASLINFFLSSAVIDWFLILINWFKPWRTIKAELKQMKSGEKYTYLELQSKLGEPNLVIDDMTEFVVNFTFVCSFTYACPSVCACAFVFNCVLCNWYVWQRLRVQRRMTPERCTGMPTWTRLMRYSLFVAVVINAGLAAFTMNPVQEYPEVERLKYFVKLEHGMLICIGILSIAIPDVPKDALRREQYNTEHEELLLHPLKVELERLQHGCVTRVKAEQLVPNVFEGEHSIVPGQVDLA